jgi:polyketide synthase 7
MFDLQGRRALVTGASGGIGGAIARALHRQGADVALSGTRKDALEALAAELKGRAHVLPADLAEPEAVDRLVPRAEEALGGLDILVNNAGLTRDGLSMRMSDEDWQMVLRVNLEAAIRLARAALRGMMKRRHGRIVSIASIVGPPGNAGQANYAAASAALEALALRRHAEALPATAVSWGFWERRSALTAKVDQSDLGRFARMGAGRPLTDEHGLALLDAAEASREPHVVAMPLDLSALAARGARAGAVPAVLRSVVRPPRRAGRDAGVDPAAVRGASAALHGASAALRNGLAGRTAAERERALTDLVRRRTAEVLGHADAESIRADEAFLELGYDSLTAVELRNHLAAATGLRLPAGLIFKYTTPAAVASHLAARLPAAEEPAAGASEQDSARRPAQDPPTGQALPDLFREACHQGKIAEGFALVEAAAQLRPTFASAEELGPDRAPVRLAQGTADRPMLLCLPSILMISGVQEYARFAAGVRGLRDVRVLAHPGFAEGEPLPASLDVLFDLHAEAALACAGDRPFVVVARSSGAWVGHAVIAELERRGAAPLALALLDPPYPTDDAALPVIETGVVEREQQLGIVDSTRLTAMGGYMRLFRGWLPGPTTTPTLILRPEEATTDREGRALPAFTWGPPHEVLQVPGDHFSMLEGHVDQVARTLHERLAAQDR